MVFCSSALLLCGLMSYSSSQGAGLIKVERDNSLSRSLELTTLVIPWEISYVLCITFVSLSLSHTHTHTHFHSFSFASVSSQSIFGLDFLTFMYFLHFFSHYWTCFLSIPGMFPSSFPCSVSLSSHIHSSFPQYLALLPHLSLSPALFPSLLTLNCTSLQSCTQETSLLALSARP